MASQVVWYAREPPPPRGHGTGAWICGFFTYYESGISHYGKPSCKHTLDASVQQSYSPLPLDQAPSKPTSPMLKPSLTPCSAPSALNRECRILANFPFHPKVLNTNFNTPPHDPHRIGQIRRFLDKALYQTPCLPIWIY